MNKLDYRTRADDDLAFELLVDGESLARRVGAQDTWIPWWLFKSGLPRDGLDDIVVGVCSCGEPGCGSTRCDIDLGGDVVTLRRFDGDARGDGVTAVFQFRRANFDEVIQAIMAHIHRRDAASR